LAEIARAPLAAEAVRHIDRVFEAEREVNRCPATDRLQHRRGIVAPLIADLHAWMLETRGRLSRHNDLARALDYALKRWAALTEFLGDGRVCLTNNAAERALRGVALGRKAWLFAGSDRGGERAAMMYALITTAKLNDVDPRAWFADVLARIADHPPPGSMNSYLGRGSAPRPPRQPPPKRQPRPSPDAYGLSMIRRNVSLTTFTSSALPICARAAWPRALSTC
jgi:hypothetical protein